MNKISHMKKNAALKQRCFNLQFQYRPHFLGGVSILPLPKVSVCGVFEAFNGLVAPCGAGLDSDEFAYIVAGEFDA